MDYVVAGFGIGAILALFGFALWELFGDVEEPETSWASRAAIGLMLGALVIWAITGVSLISHIDDSTGSRLVLLTTLVTLIAVAGGAFWYWRADRALAATRPRPAKASTQREVAVAAATVAGTDIELTDWDSWPERDAGKASASEAEPADPAPALSFEPEVAIEAAGLDAVESDSTKTKSVEAVAAEETEPLPEDNVPIEAVDDTADPEIEAPPNIRPFRSPATPAEEPSEPMVEEDVLIAEAIDVASVDVPEPTDVPAIVIEDTDTAAVVEEVQPSIAENPEAEVAGEADLPIVEPDVREALEVANGSVPPPVFESSLLADIDGSLVEDDEGYRSPLLSDLGSDKLEGVGLAKWRPDSRLKSQSEEEGAPPPAKSGRRR